MSGIDVVVLYFTLKICDSTFAQVLTLPLAPLLAFLVLLNGGYLATFVAAGGQTIGKMAAGIRVIPGGSCGAGATERVTFGQAVVRAAGYWCLGAARGPGLPARPSSVRSAARCTIASPTRASSKRDSPRRLPRDGRLLRLLLRSRPARRLGRRARRLPARLVDAFARWSRSALIVVIFAVGVWAATRRPSVISAASIPGPS